MPCDTSIGHTPSRGKSLITQGAQLIQLKKRQKSKHFLPPPPNPPGAYAYRKLRTELRTHMPKFFFLKLNLIYNVHFE